MARELLNNPGEVNINEPYSLDAAPRSAMQLLEVAFPIRLALLTRAAGNRLLHGIGRSVLASLEKSIELLYCEPETVIFENGGGEFVYLVIEGSVRIDKVCDDGNREILARIDEGSFIGQMSLLSHGPYSARATANGRAVLGRIDHAALHGLLSAAPQALLTNLNRVSVERLWQSNRLIANLLGQRAVA